MSSCSEDHDSPIKAAASHLKSTNWCKGSLEAILKFIGLHAPINASFWHYMRAVPVLILAVMALIYEACREVFFFMNNRSANSQLVNYIDELQYTVKAFSTLLYLIMFWRKSSSITRIVKKLDDLQEKSATLSTEMMEAKMNSEKKLSAFVLLTFVLYIVCMIGIRVARLLSSAPPKSPWPAASPPWDAFHMTVLDEQVFLLLTWTRTNSVKLLCSGYLALLLFRFGNFSATHCRLHLGCISTNRHEMTAIKMNIDKAWNGREEALTLAKVIQNELGVLLGFVMLADVVSLNSTLASFLFQKHIIQCLNLGLNILLHLLSILGIAIGLIHLINEVSPKRPQK
jgi:7tm Odorant receptor